MRNEDVGEGERGEERGDVEVANFFDSVRCQGGRMPTFLKLGSGI